MQAVSKMDTENIGMIVKRVSVPMGLEELMEGLTKEVLLKKPKDLYIFASEYFSRLVVLRERSSYQKAYPIRTMQSVTQLKPSNIRENKIPPSRPTRHLSRQLSMRIKSPEQIKPNQSEPKRSTVQRSRDRKTVIEKKDVPVKAATKTSTRRERSIITKRNDSTPRSNSSVQSTPREKRQRSNSRQVKVPGNSSKNVNESNRPLKKESKTRSDKQSTIKTGNAAINLNNVTKTEVGEDQDLTKINTDNENSIKTDEKSNENLNVLITENIDISPVVVDELLDSDIWAASTNVFKVNLEKTESSSSKIAGSIEKEADGDKISTMEKIFSDAKETPSQEIQRLSEDDKMHNDIIPLVEVKIVTDTTESPSLVLIEPNTDMNKDTNKSVEKITENCTNLDLIHEKVITTINVEEKGQESNPQLKDGLKTILKNQNNVEVKTGETDSSLIKNMEDVTNDSNNIKDAEESRKDIKITDKLTLNDDKPNSAEIVPKITVLESDNMTQAKSIANQEKVKDSPKESIVLKDNNMDTEPEILNIFKTDPNNIVENISNTKEDNQKVDNIKLTTETKTVDNNGQINLENCIEVSTVLKDNKSENNIDTGEAKYNNCVATDLKIKNSDNPLNEEVVASIDSTVKNDADTNPDERIEDDTTKDNLESSNISSQEDHLKDIISLDNLPIHETKNAEILASDSVNEIVQDSVEDTECSLTTTNQEEKLEQSLKPERDNEEAHEDLKNTRANNMDKSNTNTADMVKNVVDIKMEQMGDSDDVLIVSISKSPLKQVRDEDRALQHPGGSLEETVKQPSDKRTNFFRENKELGSKENAVIKSDTNTEDTNENDIILPDSQWKEDVLNDNFSITSHCTQNEEDLLVDNIKISGSNVKEEGVDNTFPIKKSNEHDKEDFNGYEDILTPLLTSAAFVSQTIKDKSKSENRVTERIIKYDLCQEQPGRIDSPIKNFLSSFLSKEQQHIFKPVEPLTAASDPHKLKQVNENVVQNVNNTSCEIAEGKSEFLENKHVQSEPDQHVYTHLVREDITAENIEKDTSCTVGKLLINLGKLSSLDMTDNSHTSKTIINEHAPDGLDVDNIEHSILKQDKSDNIVVYHNFKESSECLSADDPENKHTDLFQKENTVVFNSVKDLLDFDSTKTLVESKNDDDIGLLENYNNSGGDSNNLKLIIVANDSSDGTNNNVSEESIGDKVPSRHTGILNKRSITGDEIEEIVSYAEKPNLIDNDNKEGSLEGEFKIEKRNISSMLNDNPDDNLQTRSNLGPIDISPTKIEDTQVKEDTNKEIVDASNRNCTQAQEKLNSSSKINFEDNDLNIPNATIIGSSPVICNSDNNESEHSSKNKFDIDNIPLANKENPNEMDKQELNKKRIIDNGQEIKIYEEVNRKDIITDQKNASSTNKAQKEKEVDVLELKTRTENNDKEIQFKSMDAKTSNNVKVENLSPFKNNTEENTSVETNGKDSSRMVNTSSSSNKHKIISNENYIKDESLDQTKSKLKTEDIKSENADLRNLERPGGTGIGKDNTFVKDDTEGKGHVKGKQKTGDIDQVASVIEVRDYLDKFLQNEQGHVFQNMNESDQTDLNTKQSNNKISDTEVKESKENVDKKKKSKLIFSSKLERPLSQTNVLYNERKPSSSNSTNKNIRRARSVGIIKMGETDTKSKIPTPARRSAGRRPLVRQLEADSKELEEKLNFKRSTSSSKDDKNTINESHGSKLENGLPKKEVSGSKENRIAKDDVLIAKTILTGLDGAEKHIELIEQHLNDITKDDKKTKFFKNKKEEDEIVKSKTPFGENQLILQEIETADNGNKIDLANNITEKEKRINNEIYLDGECIQDIDNMSSMVVRENDGIEKHISGKMYDNSVKKYTEAATTIQKTWKGFHVRSNLKEHKLNNNKTKNLETTTLDVGSKDTITEASQNTIKDIHSEMNEDKLETLSNNKESESNAVNASRDENQKRIFENNEINYKKQAINNDQIKVSENYLMQRQDDEAKAAVKIQSAWKGFVVRKIKKEASQDKDKLTKRSTEEAIILIQAFVRGFLDRLKYNKIKSKRSGFENTSIKSDILNSNIEKNTTNLEGNEGPTEITIEENDSSFNLFPSNEDIGSEHPDITKPVESLTTEITRKDNNKTPIETINKNNSKINEESNEKIIYTEYPNYNNDISNKINMDMNGQRGVKENNHIKETTSKDVDYSINMEQDQAKNTTISEDETKETLTDNLVDKVKIKVTEIKIEQNTEIVKHIENTAKSENQNKTNNIQNEPGKVQDHIINIEQDNIKKTITTEYQTKENNTQNEPVKVQDDKITFEQDKIEDTGNSEKQIKENINQNEPDKLHVNKINIEQDKKEDTEKSENQTKDNITNGCGKVKDNILNIKQDKIGGTVKSENRFNENITKNGYGIVMDHKNNIEQDNMKGTAKSGNITENGSDKVQDHKINIKQDMMENTARTNNQPKENLLQNESDKIDDHKINNQQYETKNITKSDNQPKENLLQNESDKIDDHKINNQQYETKNNTKSDKQPKENILQNESDKVEDHKINIEQDKIENTAKANSQPKENILQNESDKIDDHKINIEQVKTENITKSDNQPKENILQNESDKVEDQKINIEQDKIGNTVKANNQPKENILQNESDKIDDLKINIELDKTENITKSDNQPKENILQNESDKIGGHKINIEQDKTENITKSDNQLKETILQNKSDNVENHKMNIEQDKIENTAKANNQPKENILQNEHDKIDGHKINIEQDKTENVTKSDNQLKETILQNESDKLEDQKINIEQDKIGNTVKTNNQPKENILQNESDKIDDLNINIERDKTENITKSDHQPKENILQNESDKIDDLKINIERDKTENITKSDNQPKETILQNESGKVEDHKINIEQDKIENITKSDNQPKENILQNESDKIDDHKINIEQDKTENVTKSDNQLKETILQNESDKIEDQKINIEQDKIGKTVKTNNQPKENILQNESDKIDDLNINIERDKTENITKSDHQPKENILQNESDKIDDLKINIERDKTENITKSENQPKETILQNESDKIEDQKINIEQDNIGNTVKTNNQPKENILQNESDKIDDLKINIERDKTENITKSYNQPKENILQNESGKVEDHKINIEQDKIENTAKSDKQSTQPTQQDKVEIEPHIDIKYKDHAKVIKNDDVVSKNKSNNKDSQEINTDNGAKINILHPVNIETKLAENSHLDDNTLVEPTVTAEAKIKAHKTNKINDLVSSDEGESKEIESKDINTKSAEENLQSIQNSYVKHKEDSTNADSQSVAENLRPDTKMNCLEDIIGSKQENLSNKGNIEHTKEIDNEKSEGLKINQEEFKEVIDDTQDNDYARTNYKTTGNKNITIDPVCSNKDKETVLQTNDTLIFEINNKQERKEVNDEKIGKSDGDGRQSIINNKPDFYRSNTVVEPTVIEKLVHPLGKDTNNLQTLGIGSTNMIDQNDNNNNTSKSETKLEREVRSAVQEILKSTDGEAPKVTSIEREISQAVKNIMENNIDMDMSQVAKEDESCQPQKNNLNLDKTLSVDTVLKNMSAVPPDEISRKDADDKKVLKIYEAPNTVVKDIASKSNYQDSDNDDNETQNDMKTEQTHNIPKVNEEVPISGKLTNTSYSVDCKSNFGNSENENDNTSIEIPADDLSSFGSTDSIVTVILKPKHEIQIKQSNPRDTPDEHKKVLPQHIKSDINVPSSKRLPSKALSTSALEDHVELIDQVQNSLLDQLSGKTVGTTNKFDIEQLRKELNDAASFYEDENYHSSVIDHDAEVMEYLYDFEPEDDDTYDSRVVRTPVRDLPDIAEETESKEEDTCATRPLSDKRAEHDERSFCGTPKTSIQKVIDGKPLHDHVDIISTPSQLNESCNEIIINNDNIKINTSRDASKEDFQRESFVGESSKEPNSLSLLNSRRLKHTSEFHDTVVVPLPSGAGVKIKNESKEIPPETSQTNLIDTGNQTSVQQAPAGAEVVTSRRRRSQNGVDVDVVGAQASLKDASSAKPELERSFTHQSPPPQSPRTAKQAMESEHKNNKRNNAISNNVPAAEKNMESQAATKIQAGFRGYQVRKQLKSKTAAIDQKRQLRKRSSRENMMDPKLEEKSAVKIQAGVRGFLVRRRQKKVTSSASA